MRQNLKLTIDPRILIALLSFIISLLVSSTTPLTNTDGVLYLRAADAFMTGGLAAAQSLFDNPYYSVLIGSLAQLTGIETLTAAHLINALLCAAIAWIITDLGILIGGGKAAGVCAGALLLLHPQFNGYRGYIIRDFGFWVCMLGFLNLQLRFYLTLRSRYLLTGLALLLIGALFRVESLLLAALPFLTLIILKKHVSTVRQTLYLYSGLLVLSVAVALIITTDLLVDSTSLTYPAQRFIDVGSRFLHTINQHNSAFKTYLLNGYLEDYAMAAVIAAFFVIVILKALKSFTLPYFIITVILHKSIDNLRLSRLRTAAIYTFFYYYFAILIGFTLSTTIIQGRHVLPLTLVLLPILGCYLAHWLTLQQSNLKKRQRNQWLAALFAAYLFIDSFISFGTPKTYLSDAINWLKTQPPSCTLAANETKIGYFSKMNTNWARTEQLIAAPSVNLLNSINSDYIAIEYHKKDQAMNTIVEGVSNKLAAVEKFESKKRQVIIFKANNNDTCLDSQEIK